MSSYLNQETLPILISVQVLLMLIFWIPLLIVLFRLRKIRLQFRQLLKGIRKENLEVVLERLLAEVTQIREERNSQISLIENLQKAVKTKKGNVGMVRFNAFDHEGSELSFSIAVVDDERNGFILTSIYGREDSRVYAKPLEQGSSIYNLSEEEKRALDLAGKVL